MNAPIMHAPGCVAVCVVLAMLCAPRVSQTQSIAGLEIDRARFLVSTKGRDGK